MPIDDEIKSVDPKRASSDRASSGDCDCGECDCESTASNVSTQKADDVGDIKYK
jgi:hypothetical protein